jgi:uncharacterized RDD family membrane protein YckC
MRCPKCHYLSFDPEPRCRNCGFDLSGDPADLAIAIDSPDAPLVDLALRPAAEAAPRQAPAGAAASVSAFRRAGGAADAALAARRTADSADSGVETPPAPPPVAARPSAPAATAELPLFVKGSSTAAPPAAGPRPIDSPIRTAPPAPSAPPAAPVRRPQPVGARQSKPQPPPRKTGPFDGDLLEDLQRIERLERGINSSLPVRPEPPVVPPGPPQAAEPWRGLAAAAIDASFIGLLNVAILWLTLRWSDLAFVDASLLPALPLATFFLLVALGYLLMFTAAGGQTLGKMTAGVRVVGAADGAEGRPVTVQQAVLRSMLALPSGLIFGLGFLPSAFGSGQSLHDRIAQTRIVRA